MAEVSGPSEVRIHLVMLLRSAYSCHTKCLCILEELTDEAVYALQHLSRSRIFLSSIESGVS